MFQALASNSMGQNSRSIPPTDSYSFKVILEAALDAYNKKTKQSLQGDALLTQLESCDSPAAILNLLRGQVNPDADEGLKKWLNPTVNVLYAFSVTLGEGVGLMFSPAKVIFAGIGVLLLAAKDLNESQSTLVEILEEIENFFRRLEIYAEVPPTPAMKDTMVKIMVEVLDILAIATKEMKQSRTKRFLKKLAGRSDMKDALARLDKLTSEEARMAGAQVLKNTHVIDDKLMGVGIGVRVVDEKVAGVDTQVKSVSNNVDDVKRNQLRESLRKWQSLPDPSTNHNFACDRQHEGTAEWFFRDGIFKEWKVTGSLLWVHGKPGSGKTILCSAIIEDIMALYKAGLATMAYFYFDFRDIDKQSRSSLLPSLLLQLSAHSDPCGDILFRLYEAHDNGTRQPNDGALTQCLKEMLVLPNQGPVYLILDALDECPNTSEIPPTRKRVLDLVKDLVGLQLPNLRICVTSRPEVDIRDVIEPLAFHQVSLHDESGQKEDITTYVKSVVNSTSGIAMSRWRAEEKELVIRTLSERADGMFRWVYCQLEVLQNCLPQGLRQKLTELPNTLDETYERMLKEIGTTDGNLARRILQCLTVASRPLRVKELAEILVLDFEDADGSIPKFNEDWRLQDRQQALLITCSSLIVIVNQGGSSIVQFSHFSVKEFLTSNRLASPVRDISSFHILPEPAHTIFAQACLAVLLCLHDSYSKKQIRRSFPLAEYAAQHWVDHAQFGKVSLRVEDGMRRLFDQSKPYFAAWLKMHDMDLWHPMTPQPPATPLYYASLFGFRGLAKHLVVKHPQDVNARGGRHRSPLAAALRNRHFHVAELLHQQGAVLNLASYNNRTLLVEGQVDAVQWLIEHGANVNPQQNNGRTSSQEVVGKPRKHSGIVNAPTAQDHGGSPLHLPSAHNHFKTMQLLIQHEAGVNARDNGNSTPLHLASRWGGVESVQLLIQHGADVNARDEDDSTPLHLVFRDRQGANGLDFTRDARAEIVEVLICHGADVNAQDANNSTPLHLASSWGKVESIQLLIQHGANVNALDKKSSTPLHLALFVDRPDAVGILWDARAKAVDVLFRHGADVNARDENNSTPLHLASSYGRTKSMELLIQHGADVNARDKDDSTPLHLVSSAWVVGPIWILLEHGADVTARDKNNSTPLHLASTTSGIQCVRVLIEHGADVNARDKTDSTPLHRVSSRRRHWIEIARLLLAHGANADARDDKGRTPYEIAPSTFRRISPEIALRPL